MSNIITHNTNLSGGTIQAYAKGAQTVALDLNHQLTEDGAPYYELTLLEALALARIIEAAIRDAQQGTFAVPRGQGEAA